MTRLSTMIFMLFLTTSSFALPERDEIVIIINEYAHMHKNYVTARDAGDEKQMGRYRAVIERYHEDMFLPVLPEVEYLFCVTRDDVILSSFVDMLEITGHSHSEAARWIFGKMFICWPEMVIQAIEASDNKVQVLSDAVFGFEAAVVEMEGEEFDVEDLSHMLREVK